MTEDINSMMDSLLSPDSIQPKVDILENNISGALKVSKDELTAAAIIPREGPGAVTEIMDKAIKQFLSNLFVPGSVLGDTLKTTLDLAADSLGPEGKSLQFTFIDHPGVPKVRTIEILVLPAQIKLSITGYDKVDPKNGSILKYFFEHNDYPGKLLPNGKFDYRELHKFPAVKRGDKILFISYPVEGTPGVTFSGRHLLVPEAREFDIQITEGILQQDISGDDGRVSGYILISENDGVILIKKEDDKISEIGVSNTIKLDKIDFSTGNIGTEFRSPVSIEVGEVSSEFKVNVDGKITITNLNGGVVSTSQNATIENIRSNSMVNAKKNIKSKNISDSKLISETGTIIIEGEVRDSRLRAPSVLFKSRKSLMLNNTIQSEVCDFSGGYYCGTNTFLFGKHLFDDIDELNIQLEALSETHKQANEAIEDEKGRLMPMLKNLSSEIKDENVMNLFKLLIRCFQSLEFNFAYKALENLRKVLNVMMVDKIRKSFETLQELTTRQLEIEEDKKSLTAQITESEDRLNSIKFSIAGEINPTATIKIYCGKHYHPDEPTRVIKTSNKDRNETIKIEGKFTVQDGLIIK